MALSIPYAPVEIFTSTVNILVPFLQPIWKFVGQEWVSSKSSPLGHLARPAVWQKVDCWTVGNFVLLDSPSKRPGWFGWVVRLARSGSGWVVIIISLYYIEVKLMAAVFKKKLIFMTCPLWSNLHQRQLGKTPKSLDHIPFLKLLYSVGACFGLG